MNTPLWHYPRFVHMAPPPTPDLPGSRPAEGDSRAGVRRDTESQLQLLSEKFKSNTDAMLQFSQALSGERVMSWNESGVDKKKVAQKLQKALAEIRDTYTDFKAPEGLMEMIAGLNAKKDSPEYNKALISLEAFTNAVDEYSGQMLKTQEGLKEMKGDVITGKVEGFFKTVGDRLSRGSGTEKIAMVGSLAVGLYFLFNNKTLAKYGKMAAGGLALNYLIGALTGKTGLEHLNICTPNGELPKEMQYALEKSGMKDPRHAKALMVLSGKPINNLYAAYSNSQNHEISAAAFGLHDKEMTNQELYAFMDSLVKGAGGRDQFQKKFVDNNTKDMTLLQVIMATSGHDVLNELSKNHPKEKLRMTNELRTLFADRREFQVDGIVTKIAGFKLPLPEGNTDFSSKDHFYRFRLNSGEVTLRVNDSKKDTTEKLNQLTDLFRQDLNKRLQESGAIQGRTLELRGTGWVIAGVDVKPGVKKDVFIKELDGGGIDYFIDGERLADTQFGIAKAYEKFEASQKIRDKIPLFRGLTVDITKVTTNTAGEKTYEGSVGGAPFTAVENVSTGDFGAGPSILQNGTFLRAKELWFAEQISSSDLSQLKNIPSELNEDWLTLKMEPPFIAHASGSVQENLWKSGFDAKMSSLKALYSASLSKSTGLKDAMIIEESFLSEIRGGAKTLYNQLDQRALHDEDTSANDFKGYYHQLLTLGVRSGEAQSTIRRVANRFMGEVNHEGIDGSDLFKLDGWSDTHKILLEQYLTFLAPISRKQNLDGKDREYMKMVEDKMFEKISRFTKKSDGILWTDVHQSLKADNIGDWGIKDYEDFRRSSNASEGAGPEILYTNETTPKIDMKILGTDSPPLTADLIHTISNVPNRLNNRGFEVLMRYALEKQYRSSLADLKETPFNISEINKVHARFVANYNVDFVRFFYVNGGTAATGFHTFPNQVAHLKGYQADIQDKFKVIVDRLKTL